MDWDSALASADLAAASFFDTQVFTVFPMAKPARDVNALAQPDPARDAFEFLGTLEADPEINDVGVNRNASSRSDGARNVSRLCLTALTTGWAWMPRQGDQIERDGQRLVLVSSPDRDGTDRVVLWVAKAPV